MAAITRAEPEGGGFQPRHATIERELETIYANRFSGPEREAKVKLWRTLCDSFFARYVPADGTVLDVGAGYCDFINQVRARRRIAVDLNPETARAAAPGVEFHKVAMERIGDVIEPGSVDFAFASNVFEHLRGPDALLEVLAAVRGALRPGGRLMVVQPNVRVLGGAFWDFMDHTLPLSEKGMVEAMTMAGLDVVECRARFLPYTTKSRIPQWAPLVRLYLALPPAQWLLGKQMLVLAREALTAMRTVPPADVDLIMPVYNEGANVGTALAEIYDRVPLTKRVLVVYDFDEDDTVPVVRSLADRYPGVELVKNTRGRGVLNAIRTGVAAATSEVVVITMADLSDDIAVIPRMVDLIRREGYDIVCASRYMRGGRQVGGPRLKKLLSRVAGVSLYWLAGLPTHDATNAFRAYRRAVLAATEIESRGGFEYSLEITAKAYAAGRRITEVPSTWRDRSAGQSRFQLRRWLPHYLRWYFYTLTHRPGRDRGATPPGHARAGSPQDSLR